jgi:hypothetical protein
LNETGFVDFRFHQPGDAPKILFRLSDPKSLVSDSEIADNDDGCQAKDNAAQNQAQQDFDQSKSPVRNRTPPQEIR